MKELESAQPLEAGVVESPVSLETETGEVFGEKPYIVSLLTAPRFWVMILGAFSVYLEAKGWIGEPERNLIATISAVFITVATLDKGAETMSGK